MLTKSRFTAGWQCHKLLWWTVHEPDAVERQPDRVLQDLFNQGRHVGEVARGRFPGGVRIAVQRNRPEERVAQTRAAVGSGAPAVFEASFIADATFVAVDVLVRSDDAFDVVEVKSSTSLKDKHVPDLALQVHVVRASGETVREARVMHLNPEHRYPDVHDLFAQTDATEPVEALLPRIPAAIARQHDMLEGPLPDVPIGLHCFEPEACPFLERCWPRDRDHIATLAGYGPKKTGRAVEQGIHRIGDLPERTRFTSVQRRQLHALREDRLIVEPTLADELRAFDGRLGFLDFETIMRAVPVWPDMKPWQQAAAQFSYHEAQPDGAYTHAEHLAEGPGDARPPLAEAMVRATAHADRVVMYTSFEKTRIRELQRAVPDLADDLRELERKLVDLHPVIKNTVYHPDFQGSFSLKRILTPLVPDLTYDDLIIVDGRVASVEIARLLFVADKIPRHERDRVRRDLLKYCERDTWAMVRLLERLREVA